MSETTSQSPDRYDLGLKTLDYIREKLMEWGSMAGLLIIIIELAMENEKLRQELQACREQASSKT